LDTLLLSVTEKPLNVLSMDRMSQSGEGDASIYRDSKERFIVSFLLPTDLYLYLFDVYLVTDGRWKMEERYYVKLAGRLGEIPPRKMPASKVDVLSRTWYGTIIRPERTYGHKTITSRLEVRANLGAKTTMLRHRRRRKARYRVRRRRMSKEAACLFYGSLR
jgi:hypothetical protein